MKAFSKRDWLITAGLVAILIGALAWQWAYGLTEKDRFYSGYGQGMIDAANSVFPVRCAINLNGHLIHHTDIYCKGWNQGYTFVDNDGDHPIKFGKPVAITAPGNCNGTSCTSGDFLPSH